MRARPSNWRIPHLVSEPKVKPQANRATSCAGQDVFENISSDQVRTLGERGVVSVGEDDS